MIDRGVFFRGDANRDGALNISDALYVLRYLFMRGPASPCPDAADDDDNGRIQLADAVRILRIVFAWARVNREPILEEEFDATLDLFPPCR